MAKKIFLSYPSTVAEVAERLRLALEAEGHEVFHDRSDLAAGQGYHAPLREAIARADMMVFVVTPRSVAAGSYTLSELAEAQRRWRRPAGRVLPVVLEPTPIDAIPPYLRAVTLKHPQGDWVADVSAEVARMRAPPSKRGLVLASVGALLLVAAAAVWMQWQAQRQREAAASAQRQRDADAAVAERRAQAQAQVQAAEQLCLEGSHETAWQRFDAPALQADATQALAAARENCAMRWLRHARVRVGENTFAKLVAPLKVVLAEGFARSGAGATRAADLHAHFGWAELLESSEGIERDPFASYQRALELDPTNVYAHTMWARSLLARSTRGRDEAREHARQALASGRDLPYALNGLIGAAAQRDPELAVQLADRARRAAVAIAPETSTRLWSALYYFVALNRGGDDVAAVLGALPPADGLAAFLHLFPRDKFEGDRLNLWLTALARLQLAAGRKDEARVALQQVRAALGPAFATGGHDSLAGAVKALLAQAGP